MSPALLITLGVLVLVGLVFFVWQNMGKGSDIGKDAQTYYCVFDDGEAHVSLQDLYTWQANGDAIISRDMGGIPTRVRCPVCDRPSCIRPDPETGEERAANPEWNLEDWDFNPGGRGAAP